MVDALGQAALRTLLLGCIVQSALWLFRIRQPQLRLIGWTVVLAASLAMPVLQQVTPLQTAVGLDIPVPFLTEIAQPQLPPFASAAPASTMPGGTGLTRVAWPWLEAVYLLVGAILLLRLATGIALSVRLLCRASPVGAEWAAGTRIRISPDVTAPVTVLNTVLLPADIAHWPAAMRHAVLAHERAHVARWDYAMLLASQLNRVVFWFSPFSWWLHRRLTRLAELASDDHALQVTGDRPGYAEVLLEMGRRSGPLLRGLAMARPAMLMDRIERVLREGGRPRSAGRVRRSSVLLGAAGLAVAAATLEPSSNPATKPGASVPNQEAAAPLDTDRPSPADAADTAAAPVPATEPKAVSIVQTPIRSGSAPPAAVPQSRPTKRVVTRLGRPLGRDTLPLPPLRQASLPIRDLRPSDEAHAASFRPEPDYRAPPPPIYQTVSYQGGHPAAKEPNLLKLIDQQTCSGAYLPSASGRYPGSWLNMISAKFFRNADGTAWLTFHVGGQTPVDLPVRVDGAGVEFTAMQATTFKVLAKGANHLTGTTERPYGTIDLACGGSNSHLFDRADGRAAD